MTHILTDLSTPAVVHSIQQNMYELCWSLRTNWTQSTFEEHARLRRYRSPVPMDFIFNAAYSTQPPEGDESELIEETIAFFKTGKRKSFAWWLFPGLETSNWGPQLTDRGFKYLSEPPGMAAVLSSLPAQTARPDGLKITRVEDEAAMLTFCKTFVEGYEMPMAWEPFVEGMMLATLGGKMISFLAEVDGHPVATSSLFLQAGVAGIYNVATLEHWRGKGIGAAVTLHPLLEARQLGYQVGILQSSEMGYPIYQRLGFKENCRMNHYHWEG